MSTSGFVSGWEYLPDDIAAAQERMIADHLDICGSGTASFRGEWKNSISAGRTAFLACTVEDKPVPAYRQSTGVCTSMVYRALQDCLNWDRKKFGGLGRPAEICFEPLFAGSRVDIGRGQLGYRDGSIGAWISEYIARYGCIERGIYSGVDLRKPREDLAQSWGKPNAGVPIAIRNLGVSHRFKSHRCTSTDELADAMACGMFGGICRSHYTSGIDSAGFAVFGYLGGHHTCLRGAFIDRRSNRRVFVEQQTHGSGVPDANPIARTTDGDVPLSDGSYLVREEDIARFIPSGEVWVYQIQDGEEFR